MKLSAHEPPSEIVRDGPPRCVSKIPLVGEGLSPWLLAALAAAGANLLVVVRGAGPSTGHGLLLLLLAVTLTSAGLVAARSGRALAATIREERARPAAEELDDVHDEVGAAPYVLGMQDRARAMLELIEHAREVTATGHPAHVELSAAADDTEAVLELLGTATDHHHDLSDRATLHAVCTLWEMNQAAAEQLAAQVDGPWHRRWRARSVVAVGPTGRAPRDRIFLLPFCA